MKNKSASKKLSSILGALGLVAATVGILLFSLFDQTFHFVSAVHGVVALISFVLFLLMGGLRGALMESPGEVDTMLRKEFRLQILYLFFVTGVFLVAGFMVKKYIPTRVDFTEEQAYSLSTHTQQILEKINKPIIARGFFIGGEVPASLRELLDRYATYSANFRWIALDPDKDRPLTESLGIQEKDTIHFSFQDSDQKGITLARVLNEEGITNSLIKLVGGKKSQVFVTTVHGEGDFNESSEAGYSFLKEAIEGEGFEVLPIDLMEKDRIPLESSLLLVLAPRRPFLEPELRKVDDYLEKGGRAVFLLEPASVALLKSILESRGFSIGEDTIVDREAYAFQGASLGVQPLVDTFSDHASVKNFNKTIILSTALSVRKAPMGDRVREIAFTSSTSWAEKDLMQLYSETPTAEKDAEDIHGPVSIAAVWENATVGPGRITVLGDSDFLANVNIRQLFNRDFFLNLLNWTSGEEDIVSIRAGTLRRSQQIISPQQFQGIFLVVGVLLPEFLILLGIASWISRKS